MKAIIPIAIACGLSTAAQALEFRFVDVTPTRISFELEWGETSSSDPFSYGQLANASAYGYDLGQDIILDAFLSGDRIWSGHLEWSSGREFGDIIPVGGDNIILDPVMGDEFAALVSIESATPHPSPVPDAGWTLGLLGLGLCTLILRKK